MSEFPWEKPCDPLTSRKAPWTSHDAAIRVSFVSGKLRKIIFAYIESKGAHGATCDECERDLGLKHQTCSARINELAGRSGKFGPTQYIVPNGKHRRTRSATGSRAEVYVVNTPEFLNGNSAVNPMEKP